MKEIAFHGMVMAEISVPDHIFVCNFFFSVHF